jgi:hypothetical protein
MRYRSGRTKLRTMIVTSNPALQRRVHWLPDGRRVTLRHAVPSDAPRLASLVDDEPSVRDVIALNDHGAIVGLAGVSAATEIAEGWAASGLASLLEDALADER